MQAGIDHDGELPGEDGYLVLRDPGTVSDAERQRDLLLLADGLDLGDADPLLTEKLCDLICRAGATTAHADGEGDSAADTQSAARRR